MLAPGSYVVRKVFLVTELSSGHCLMVGSGKLYHQESIPVDRT